MRHSRRAYFDNCKIALFGAIGANYSLVGSVFTYNPRILYIQNLTDVTLWFSTNGTDNKFPLLAGTYVLFDITSNKAVDNEFTLGLADAIYVKRFAGAPTSGGVYVTAVYGD